MPNRKNGLRREVHRLERQLKQERRRKDHAYSLALWYTATWTGISLFLFGVGFFLGSN